MGCAVGVGGGRCLWFDLRAGVALTIINVAIIVSVIKVCGVWRCIARACVTRVAGVQGERKRRGQGFFE